MGGGGRMTDINICVATRRFSDNSGDGISTRSADSDVVEEYGAILCRVRAFRG